jgi:peptidoglycan/LPS O-acetylase OafA/YrhL
MTMTLGSRASRTSEPAATAAVEKASPSRSASKGSRIAVVDGLRLVAAVSVALFHLSGCAIVAKAWGAKTDHIFPTINKFTAYGFLGVELFFMISGFVICMSAWGRSLGDFARSRITRLFPAYWPAVIITTVVVTIWPVITERLPTDQIAVNLVMLNMPLKVPNVDNVYWTLWSEARFYLLFGVVLVWRGLTLKRTLLFGYGWLIASIFTVNGGVPILTTILQPDMAPLFVAGMAFFLIHRFGHDLKLWGLVGFAYALALHNVVGRIDSDAKNNHYHLSHAVGFGLITIFFAIMAVIAMGWTARIQWKWLTTAGLLTYPFYLLHQNIGWAIIHAMRDVRPRKLTLVVVILIMLVLAWLLHKLIEKPLAKVLKRKLAESSVRLRAEEAKALAALRPQPAPAPAVDPADAPTEKLLLPPTA